MAKYLFLAMIKAVPGREAEFDAWYDNQHLADVGAVPGIQAATRFEVVNAQGPSAAPSPLWRSLAIYEIETDGDPATIIAEVKARAGTKLMPISPAVSKDGMLQLLVRPAQGRPA